VSVGQLSVDLPWHVREGQVFTIVLRQVRAGRVAQLLSESLANAATVDEGIFSRRTLSTFPITIPVRTNEVVLDAEERRLSVLRSILESIPEENRWFLVFRRHIEHMASHLKALGGEREQEEFVSFTGKIAGLAYDRLGDFEGFIVDTEDGERTFASRESRVEQLIQRAWTAQIVVTVFTTYDDLFHPTSIVLRRPLLGE
jgi:hypothetical protein